MRIAYFFVLIMFIIAVVVLGFVIGGWYGVAVAACFALLAYKNNSGEL